MHVLLEGGKDLANIEDLGHRHLASATVTGNNQKLPGMMLPPSICEGSSALFYENWAVDFHELTPEFRNNFKPEANQDLLSQKLE